jgi:hypothetical protein
MRNFNPAIHFLRSAAVCEAPAAAREWGRCRSEFQIAAAGRDDTAALQSK